MIRITAEATLTLAGALAVDRWLGEPPARLHPVVWIGQAIDLLAKRAPDDGAAAQLAAGAAMTAALIAVAAGAGRLVERAPGGFVVRFPIRVWLLSSTFAGRGLLAAARRIEADLAAADVIAARSDLRALVSRPTADLDEALIVAATVESVAENASDSFVAPLLAYAVGGLPAALAYRAINTLDAMLGYRGRYEYLGKAGARLDDLVNLIPARATGLLIAVCAGSWRSTGQALKIGRRDAGRTASPNAGWPMAAMAGALGVELVKVDHYRLGDAIRPLTPERLQAATAIVSRVLTLAAGLTLAATWARDAA